MELGDDEFFSTLNDDENMGDVENMVDMHNLTDIFTWDDVGKCDLFNERWRFILVVDFF